MLIRLEELNIDSMQQSWIHICRIKPVTYIPPQSTVKHNSVVEVASRKLNNPHISTLRQDHLLSSPLSVPENAPICCVMPPNSWSTMWECRMASKRVVFPWSTCPMIVTTGGRLLRRETSARDLKRIEKKSTKMHKRRREEYWAYVLQLGIIDSQLIHYFLDSTNNTICL